MVNRELLCATLTINSVVSILRSNRSSSSEIARASLDLTALLNFHSISLPLFFVLNLASDSRLPTEVRRAAGEILYAQTTTQKQLDALTRYRHPETHTQVLAETLKHIDQRVAALALAQVVRKAFHQKLQAPIILPPLRRHLSARPG